MTNKKPDKKVKDSGFQVSVSKIFPVSTNMMWEFLLSEPGIAIWLGKIDMNEFELQKPFVTEQGLEGKLTVFVPDCHLRFKWKPQRFQKATTVELRVTNTKGRATVIFHHTNFFKIAQREALRTYWKNVISKMMIELTKKHG